MIQENVDLIIYHKDCPDGWCAAFIAKKKYPNAELLGITYGEPAPINEVFKKDVLVVDFSWNKTTSQNLARFANSFQILDHHKTAEAELTGLDFALFDMNRSGAALTWDTLFPNEPRPWYVEYVQDRDLWQWKLLNSKEVNAYLMALPMTIEGWSSLYFTRLEKAMEIGSGILEHVENYVQKVVAQYQPGTLEGHSIAIINAAYPNISEVGNELCKYAEIGVGYFERADQMIQFSLRSIGDLDVSEIAKKYGGGGHKNAAGFQLQYKEGRELIDKILERQ